MPIIKYIAEIIDAIIISFFVFIAASKNTMPKIQAITPQIRKSEKLPENILERKNANQ